MNFLKGLSVLLIPSIKSQMSSNIRVQNYLRTYKYAKNYLRIYKYAMFWAHPLRVISRNGNEGPDSTFLLPLLPPGEFDARGLWTTLWEMKPSPCTTFIYFIYPKKDMDCPCHSGQTQTNEVSSDDQFNCGLFGLLGRFCCLLLSIWILNCGI